MNTKVDITLRALQFLAGDTEHICRLCLSGNQGLIPIQDSTRLREHYYDNTVTFYQMFQELEVNEELELPQVLCSNCAKMTINAYLFKKLCNYSDLKWDETFNEFDKTLEKANKIGPNVKTVYFLINKNENIMFSSKKSNFSLDKRNILNRVKDIMKSRKTYYVKVKGRKQNVICDECGEWFKSNCHLVKHMKSHSNIRFLCPYCPKIFTTQIQLDEHSERLHYPKKIQCLKCPKRFSTEKMLKYHDKLHHVAAICKLCFVQFPSKKDLRSHLDKHDVNKCPLCMKSFLNKHTYKIHLKICGNPIGRQLSFFCDICNKGYARKNGLRTHLKTEHGFGNVLSCKWCQKKFDAASRLRNHIVKHTKERKFHCEQCGNRFVTQAALVYHFRLHTGEKPFPCDMCDESFLSASRRMEHKRRKHIGPTKECHICHVKFVTGHQLRIHVQRHYNPQSKLYVPKADQFINDSGSIRDKSFMNFQSNLLSI